MRQGGPGGRSDGIQGRGCHSSQDRQTRERQASKQPLESVDFAYAYLIMLKKKVLNRCLNISTLPGCRMPAVSYKKRKKKVW